MDKDTASVANEEFDDPETQALIAGDRDRISEDRDQRAEAHDRASTARDERATERDERAEARDEATERVDTGAAADRAGALRDRLGGASDRVQAADDRQAAAADRVVSAREREASSIDDLTGAYRRDAGTIEMEREIARAKRSNQTLLVAFIDVDGLKARNDSLGHAAGDELLSQTVTSLRSHLRSYDLVVRYGGDEFVAVLVDLSVSEAVKRFEAVNAEIAEICDGSITVGMAELEEDDSLQDVIARADGDLYNKREGSR